MRISAAQIKEKQEPTWEKPKTTSETKFEKPVVFLRKTENQVLKTENPLNAMITQIEKPI